MAPNFDTNTWYQITESRIDFNGLLQIVKDSPSSLVMATAGKDNFQYWQIFPLKNGSAVLRNRAQGIGRQLGVCHTPDENDASKTAPCMVETANDPSQKWDITTWATDGAQKLQNVGNGTGYNLDCHQGNPLFMSSTTAPKPVQPAQHWLFSSIGVINDVTYSTAGAGQNSLGASSPSATATSPSSTPTNRPSSGISPGAAAGIGVGVGLVVIAAVAFLLFFLRRRKRNKTTTPIPPVYENSNASTTPLGGTQREYKYGSPPVREQYEMDGHAPVELSNGQYAQQAHELSAK